MDYFLKTRIDLDCMKKIWLQNVGGVVKKYIKEVRIRVLFLFWFSVRITALAKLLKNFSCYPSTVKLSFLLFFIIIRCLVALPYQQT